MSTRTSPGVTQRAASADGDYAREVLSLLLGILVEGGYSPANLRRELDALLRTAGKPDRVWDPTGLDYVADLPHVLAHWHNDPHYLTGDGTPLAIGLTGPEPSLGALVARVFPQGDPTTIVKVLLRTRAIRRVGKRFLPRERRVAYEYERELARLQALNDVRSMLRTVHYNIRVGHSGMTLFERTATNPAFPVSELESWNQSIKVPAGRVIEGWDAKMEQIAARADRRGPTVRAGIGIYAFHDPLPPRVARRAKPKTSRARTKQSHRT